MKATQADLRSTVHAEPARKADPKVREAAKQFEGILLRQMVSELQKTAHLGGGPQTGGQLYESLVSEALADAVERAGGLGLADSIARSMQARDGAPLPTRPVAKKDPQASPPQAVSKEGNEPSHGTSPRSATAYRAEPSDAAVRPGSGTASGSGPEDAALAAAPFLLRNDETTHVVMTQEDDASSQELQRPATR